MWMSWITKARNTSTENTMTILVRQMERGLGDAIERTAFPGDSRFFRKTGVSLNYTPENRDKNLNYMPKGHTTGMTTRQMMRERMHMGMPTFA